MTLKAKVSTKKSRLSYKQNKDDKRSSEHLSPFIIFPSQARGELQSLSGVVFPSSASQFAVQV